MRCIQTIGLAVCMLWVSGAWAQALTKPVLTKPMVQQVINAVEVATNQLDPHALGAMMADDVVIELNINMLGQQQVVSPNKDEYIEVLSQAWTHFEGYQYQRTETDIDLHEDRAVVRAKVRESMVINGQKVAGTSSEEVEIRLVGGEPKITHVVGFSSL